MAVFICSNCGAVVEKSSIPSQTGCPKGNHRWFRICSEGSIVPKPDYSAYQCKYCGVVIYCKHRPFSYPCVSGRSHVWMKL